jgi:hypothetical protein
MSLQLQIEETQNYLIARFIGSGVVEDVWRHYELIAEHCKRVNKNKLLLDYTKAHGEASLVDRYYLGDRGRVFAKHNIKVATVDRPERLDPRRFGVMVAQNRGVNVRAFTNAEDAAKWLLE